VTSKLASDLDLIELIEENTGASIQRFERRSSGYRTSFAIEELIITFSDGVIREYMFKDLSRESLSPTARAAKPTFLFDPKRELIIYKTILSSERLGTAECIATACDAEKDRYWLIIEKVSGRELYQVGDIAEWADAARWLARLQQWSQERISQIGSAPLIQYDRAFYFCWIQRALENCAGATRKLLHHGNDWYHIVVDQLMNMPPALLHGDFYASNIIVQHTSAGLRVCPIDWEMAAWGPAFIDLAALTSGKWSDRERQQITDAYFNSCQPPITQPDFNRSLNLARLHLAIQWLGWSKDWQPPAEHTQDWTAEVQKYMELLF
jgi:hypothetical protein